MADAVNEIKILQAKLDAAEREKQMFNLERSKWSNERASFELQLQDALEAERRKVKMEVMAAGSANSASNDVVNMLREENASLSRQMDMIRKESNKQLNALEISNTKHVGRISTLERELTIKSESIDISNRDLATTKANMERVIKDLVDRNKKLEDEASRKHQAQSQELSIMMKEHEQLTVELVNQRQQAHALHDERALVEAQVADGKAVNQHLLDDIDALTAKLHASEQSVHEAEREIENLKTAEDETRLDLEVAVGKLEKADTHIKRLSDEAAAYNVEVTKLKHNIEVLEEQSTSTKREREEFSVRIGQATITAAEDLDKLISDIEAMVLTIKDVLVQSGHLDVESASRSALPTVKPTQAMMAAQGSEATTMQTLLRIRDAVNLMREDIVLGHRALVEESKRCREAIRKSEALEEGFQAERAHVLDLTNKLSVTEEAASMEKAKFVEAERSLQESSQWMAEAVSMGEERTKRMEVLLDEKADVEHRLARSETEKTQLRSKIQDLTDELVGAQTESNRLQSIIKHQGTELAASESDNNKLRTHSGVLKLEVETVNEQIHSAKDEATEHKQRASKLETENMHLHRQMTELDRASRNKEAQITRMEAENNSLRDKLFESQKRLDGALRRETSVAPLQSPAFTPYRHSSTAAAGMSTPPPSTPGQHNTSISAAVTDSDRITPSMYRAASPAAVDTSSRLVTSDKVADWENKINALLQRSI